MTARQTRPVLITTGRHPFEIAMLIAAGACGAALMFVGNPPRSVSAAMPGLIQVVWQLGLMASSGIALAGICWPGRLAGQLGAEAVGMVLLGSVTSMYAVALVAVSGAAATAAATFVIAVAVASWIRFAQIGLDLRRVAAAAAAGRTADVTLMAEDLP